MMRMLVENLREAILFYADNFYLVDFVLIVFVFFFFVCVLFLCVFLRHRPIIALFIVAFDIAASFFIYIYGYKFVDHQVRKRTVAIENQRFIQSSGALVIDFNITNVSKHHFKQCKITAKLYQNPSEEDNFLEAKKKNFIPFRKKSKILKDVPINTTQIQRISFENFDKDNNHTTRLASECF